MRSFYYTSRRMRYQYFITNLASIQTQYSIERAITFASTVQHIKNSHISQIKLKTSSLNSITLRDPMELIQIKEEISLKLKSLTKFLINNFLIFKKNCAKIQQILKNVLRQIINKALNNLLPSFGAHQNQIHSQIQQLKKDDNCIKQALLDYYKIVKISFQIINSKRQQIRIKLINYKKLLIHKNNGKQSEKTFLIQNQLNSQNEQTWTNIYASYLEQFNQYKTFEKAKIVQSVILNNQIQFFNKKETNSKQKNRINSKQKILSKNIKKQSSEQTYRQKYISINQIVKRQQQPIKTQSSYAEEFTNQIQCFTKRNTLYQGKIELGQTQRQHKGSLKLTIKTKSKSTEKYIKEIQKDVEQRKNISIKEKERPKEKKR